MSDSIRVLPTLRVGFRTRTLCHTVKHSVAELLLGVDQSCVFDAAGTSHHVLLSKVLAV